MSELRQILREDLPAAWVGDEQIGKFINLLELLQGARGQLNVTTLTDPHEIATAHFADSLAGLDAEPRFASALRAADIGPGGGFPILPLAIVQPHIDWTGIESVAKKSRFIEETAKALRLTNVTMKAERAETVARSNLRGQFDLVTARAVGPVSSLLEVGVPLLKPGGRILLYKTESALVEWTEAGNILQKLNAAVLPVHSYRFPDDRQTRFIFRAELQGGVDEKYPRPNGVPFKRPLT